uniref:Uncharacterized protein n=1 Tax=Timema douglasi TaxID=61478 RepID=A0A7R8VK41_TIMDO|nr:unnamed protein product [Timema douglasi]
MDILDIHVEASQMLLHEIENPLNDYRGVMLVTEGLFLSGSSGCFGTQLPGISLSITINNAWREDVRYTLMKHAWETTTSTHNDRNSNFDLLITVSQPPLSCKDQRIITVYNATHVRLLSYLCPYLHRVSGLSAATTCPQFISTGTSG